MKLSLATFHSFYVFPRLRNWNLSHIPARREYVFKIPRSFRTLCRSRPHTPQVNREGQTILMVTHSVKAASSAGRVLFIRDGQVFHQIYRGNLTDEEMYQKISAALTVLATGGEVRE